MEENDGGKKNEGSLGGGKAGDKSGEEFGRENNIGQQGTNFKKKKIDQGRDPETGTVIEAGVTG